MTLTPTTPPTNAQMDALFQTQVIDRINAGPGTSIPPQLFPWFSNPSGGFFVALGNQGGTSPQVITAIYVGWTDTTGKHYMDLVVDPRLSYYVGLEQFTDPDVGGGTPYLMGLIEQYGAINLREYTFTCPSPSDIVPSSSAEQTSLNDQANWVAAP
jgi:hypothetical protein